MSNASIGEISGFAETTEAQFGRFFDIHVKGVFFLTRALLPLLVDSGRIVDVSSKRDTPAFNEVFSALVTLGRVGLPDDIGPAVASLLGPDNRWITAPQTELSGGQNT